MIVEIPDITKIKEYQFGIVYEKRQGTCHWHFYYRNPDNQIIRFTDILTFHEFSNPLIKSAVNGKLESWESVLATKKGIE